MSTRSGDIAISGGPAVGKQEWVQQHASHMLQHWRQWRAPLGVAPSYVTKLEKDLAKCYDEPLLKAFIEHTY
jgi:hypothetical protein